MLLQLGRQVLEPEGANAFLVSLRCASAERCLVDRAVFKPGTLGEPCDTSDADATVATAAIRGLTLRRLGEALYASGHGEPALSLLQHVSQHDPSPAERAAALSDVAAMAHGIGDLESARDLLRAALFLYPAHPEALENALAVDAASADGPRAVPVQRRLVIGERAVAGWELMAEAPGVDVHHVGRLHDLGAFAPQSFAELYVAGSLEAYDLSRSEALLRGALRVLVPNGRLTLELLDVAKAAVLLAEQRSSTSQHLHVLRRMFGGRGERGAAFTEQVIVALLTAAGFVSVERVEMCPVAVGAPERAFAMYLTARAPG